MEMGLLRWIDISLHPFFEFEVGHPLLRIKLIQFHPDPSKSYRMWSIVGIVLMSPFSCQHQNQYLRQQFQMNRYISQFLEFYRRKEKLLGLDFNQFSNFFYLHQLALSIYF